MLTPTSVTRAAFNTAIKSDAPTHVRITVGNNQYVYTDANIDSSGIDIRDYLNAEEDLTIGKCVTKEITINFLKTDDTSLTTISAILYSGFKVEFGVEINGTTQWVNLGNFYPYTPEYYVDDDKLTIVAHDRMDKFNVPAESWLKSLTFPMTVSQMFTSLCTYVGLSSDTGNALSNMLNRSFAECPITNLGVMCSEVLECIAEACGCYARMTPGGACKLTWVTYTGYDLNVSDIYERNRRPYTSKVEGLNVRDTEEDVGVLYPSGATSNIYVIVDNPFLKTANSSEETNYIVPLYDRLRSINHYPVEVACVGNPLIEAGDYIGVDFDGTSYGVPIFVKESHWNGAMIDSYVSSGRQNRKSYTANVRQKMSEGGRYHLFKNDIDSLESEIGDVAGDVTLIDQKADNIALEAGKKARMWYSNTAPTGTTADPLVANVDYWIDTAHDRKLMRWTGSAWAAADDVSKYTKYSGIDITQNGVDITGSKYVKIRSGGSFYVEATNFKIDSANKLMKCGAWQFDDNGVSYTLDSNTEFRIIKANALSAYPKTKTGIRMNKVDGNYLFSIIIPDISNNVKEFVFSPYYATNGRSAGISFEKPSGTDCSIGSETNQWDYGFFEQVGAAIAPACVYSDRLYMTSAASGKGIVFKGTKADSNLIRFWDNTSDAYGNGIVIGDGGCVIIGAGESAGQVRASSGAVAGTETLYLAADSDVKILSNVQNGYSSRKEFTFGTNGNFTAPGRLYQNGGTAVPLQDTNTWRGYQTKQYTYQYTIPANGEVRITGADLGVSTPSGYTPVAITFYNTDNTNVYPIWLSAEATGSSWVAILRSIFNSQLIQTFTVKILYLQTGNP